MYKGSCHCGRLSFEVEGECTEVNECNCSICSRKGYLLWFVPRTTVQITKGEGESSVYRFHRMAIEHHFCPTCGCAPYGFGSMPDGTKMAAVNARCLEELDLSQLKRNQLDGKSF